MNFRYGIKMAIAIFGFAAIFLGSDLIVLSQYVCQPPGGSNYPNRVDHCWR